MLSLLLQALLLCSALLLFASYTKRSTSKLPPGPLALPLIGHLYLFEKPLHHCLARISKRYGPATFLRFGTRPVLLISSQALAEQCFTTHDLAFANRPQLLSTKFTQRSAAGIGIANYGPYWRSVRRIAAVELLSAQRLQASSDVRAAEVRAMAGGLFRSWEASCGPKGSGLKKVELKKSLFELSLNVLTTLIAGKRFYGDKAEDQEETRRFRRAVEEQFKLSGASNVEDFVPLLGKLDLKGRLKKKAYMIKQQREMIRALVEEHRRGSGGEPKRTMIAHLLELQKKDPEEPTDQAIQSICFVGALSLFLFHGSICRFCGKLKLKLGNAFRASWERGRTRRRTRRSGRWLCC